MIPKGKLFIIGGAEDKAGEDSPDMLRYNKEAEHFEVLKKLLPENRCDMVIEVITSASEMPGEVRKTYSKALKEIGYSDVGYIHIETKDQAHDPKNIKRLEKAATILFSGGDQFHLTSLLGGTPVEEILHNRYENDKEFIVAGTSAGAMAIGDIMIREGGKNEVLIDTDIKTVAGFKLLKGCIVDTHFIKRCRFGRLSHSIIINPGLLGIGLGEDTALLIKNGNEATCYGSGMVVIIDGKEITKTNIADAESGCPVYVENLKVHLLVKDCRFSIQERKLMEDEKVKEKEKEKH
jgi:cyanophycinase